MKRLLHMLLLVLAPVAAESAATTYTATNDISSIPAPMRALTGTTGIELRYTLYCRQGTSIVTHADTFATWALTDLGDGTEIATVTGVLVNATNAQHRFTRTFTDTFAAEAVGRLYDASSTAYIGIISWDTLTITNAGATGGDCSPVSVTFTNSIEWQPVWEIDGGGNIRPYGGIRSLMPYADLGGDIGSPTQRFGVIYVSNLVALSISGSIEALDTGAVHKVDADYTTTVARAASAIQPTDATYTTAVAQAGSAVQTEADPVFAAWQPNAVTNGGGSINGVAFSNGAAITITAGGDIYSTNNNSFGSPGSPRTNTFHGRIIARDPGNVAGAPVASELDTSNDVGLVLSSVDNGANAEGSTIAPKMEIVSYAGGGYATMRRASNAAAGAGSWPVISMVQFSSTPWLQLGFVSDAGGTVSNVCDIYGTSMEFNPQSRTNVTMDFFGAGGQAGRISGHQEFSWRTLKPQTHFHVSNATLRVDNTGTGAAFYANGWMRMGNVTSPPASVSDGVVLFATNGELQVKDSAGNQTQLSPHRDDAWTYDSVNEFTGRRVTIDMEALALAVQQLTGQQIVQISTQHPARTWRARELELVAESQRLRAQWVVDAAEADRRRAAWDRERALAEDAMLRGELPPDAVPPLSQRPTLIESQIPPIYVPRAEPDFIRAATGRVARADGGVL